MVICTVENKFVKTAKTFGLPPSLNGINSEGFFRANAPTSFAAEKRAVKIFSLRPKNTSHYPPSQREIL